jgi:hypothetical protein
MTTITKTRIPSKCCVGVVCVFFVELERKGEKKKGDACAMARVAGKQVRGECI